mgnify:CR=1 FL=1
MGIRKKLGSGALLFAKLTAALVGTVMGLAARSLKRSSSLQVSETQSSELPESNQTTARGQVFTMSGSSESFKRTDGLTVANSQYGWVTSPTIGWSRVSLGTIEHLTPAEALLWRSLENQGSNLPN